MELVNGDLPTLPGYC